MKTKMKKILSIALPILGLTTSLAIAAPMIVSCSDSGSSQDSNQPQEPTNQGNGSGAIQTIKTTPKNKYAS